MGRLFDLDGDVATPTPHVASPWNPATQAGGAAAAMLALLVEREARPELRAARATAEILAPIPMAPAHVRVTPIRRGRSTEFWTASLHTDEAEVLRLSVWRIAPAPTLDRDPASVLPAWVPEEHDDDPLPSLFEPVGYAAAQRWRFVHGGFDVPGAGRAWTRPRHPVLAGEPTPTISRLLLASATANGLGAVLDPARHLYVDVDITVHCERELDGHWVDLDASTRVASGTTGRAEARLGDRAGELGRATLTLLVAGRTR